MTTVMGGLCSSHGAGSAEVVDHGCVAPNDKHKKQVHFIVFSPDIWAVSRVCMCLSQRESSTIMQSLMSGYLPQVSFY